jgi:hypothetical protein
VICEIIPLDAGMFSAVYKHIETINRKGFWGIMAGKEVTLL